MLTTAFFFTIVGGCLGWLVGVAWGAVERGKLRAEVARLRPCALRQRAKPPKQIAPTDWAAWGMTDDV